MPYRYQKGESLIEFMLVLVLSLFIIGGAFKLLIIAKREMQYQLAENELTQSLLIGERELKIAVESSGLASCGQAASLLSFKNSAEDSAGRLALAQGTSVQAFKISQVQNWDLDKAGSGQAADDTDVLVVRKISEESALSRDALKNAVKISLVSRFKIKPGQVLIISDCRHLLSDRVVGVQGKTVELETPLYFGFKKGSFVGKFEFEAYYVGKTLRKNARAENIKALYMQDTKGVRHELVPDLSELRLHALSDAIEADIKVQSEETSLSEKSKMVLY